ncbi:hypothetical protein GCM10007857_63710 [Bradyrhizobium iriomotense]|uniref:Uncharacterized protein n=1 Tax=Bradyrhizobium iriomotense TaxID=441950 RepID=A0ABQ6BC12_9BRAD|nr:hypothetical protein GCM10007857_63710 [Bradyrhizobium iriomotense]
MGVSSKARATAVYLIPIGARPDDQKHQARSAKQLKIAPCPPAGVSPGDTQILDLSGEEADPGSTRLVRALPERLKKFTSHLVND